MAYWNGPPDTKDRCWRTTLTARIRCAGPYAQPTFHPVKENDLPPEPIVMVRSNIPGSVAMGI